MENNIYYITNTRPLEPHETIVKYMPNSWDTNQRIIVLNYTNGKPHDYRHHELSKFIWSYVDKINMVYSD